MAYSTTKLLALPNKEKRALAKKLWQSLDANVSFVKEDAAIIKMLDERSKKIESGKMKMYTSKEFWSIIDKHLRSKK